MKNRQIPYQSVRGPYSSSLFYLMLLKTDVPLTSPKCKVEETVSKFGHTTMRNESIRTYPKTTNFLSNELPII